MKKTVSTKLKQKMKIKYNRKACQPTREEPFFKMKIEKKIMSYTLLMNMNLMTIQASTHQL